MQKMNRKDKQIYLDKLIEFLSKNGWNYQMMIQLQILQLTRPCRATKVQNKVIRIEVKI